MKQSTKDLHDQSTACKMPRIYYNPTQQNLVIIYPIIQLILIYVNEPVNKGFTRLIYCL